MSGQNTVRHAVVPAAGFGTRLRPLTDHLPKEMLPIGRMPVIGHIMEDLAASGIATATIVLSEAKELIRGYCADGSRWGMECRYAVQPAMRGVGDATLRGLSESDRLPVLVAFGDCAVLRQWDTAGPSATERLIDAYRDAKADAAVLCEQAPWESVHRYGVLDPAVDTPEQPTAPFDIRGIVEKPERARAPSRLVVAARWILGCAAIEALRRTEPGSNGEVGVTEAIADVISRGGRVIGVPLGPGERRCDVGNIPSYLAAQVFASLNDPEYGPGLRECASAQ
ncbi:MAG: NTP transferase domain-containing protein [Chthonomonadales bacterium]|nr:NTP transferase domain-containing protein [Chthonomonadales bacterium]